MSLQIKFINPLFKIEGENRSKLLHPDSDIFKYIVKIRDLLTSYKIQFDARPPHIELFSSQINQEDIEYKNRISKIENTYANNEVNMLTDKALVIYTGIVNFYGPTHATIAYFKEGVNNEQFELLKKWIDSFSATEEEIERFKKIQNDNLSTSQPTRKFKDWFCEKCQFKIFGHKSECFKCKTKRPDN